MERGYQPTEGSRQPPKHPPKGGSAADKTVKITYEPREFCDMCYRKGYRYGYDAGDKNAFVIALNIIETEIKAVSDGAYGPEAALDFARQVLKAMKGGEQG